MRMLSCVALVENAIVRPPLRVVKLDVNEFAPLNVCVAARSPAPLRFVPSPQKELPVMLDRVVM